MNKDVEYYMSQPYTMLISGGQDEGFHVSLIEIPECNATGRTMAEMQWNMNIAKREWFQEAIRTGIPIPETHGRKRMYLII